MGLARRGTSMCGKQMQQSEKWLETVGKLRYTGLNRNAKEPAMAIELNIDPDTVRLFSQKARAIAENVDDTFEDGHEHDVEFDSESLSDSQAHEGLREEEGDNFTLLELRELIDDLNIDEAAELVAIVWIGRGDYEATDWDTAVTEARARAHGPTARYLLGMNMLADYIEEGLAAIDK